MKSNESEKTDVSKLKLYMVIENYYDLLEKEYPHIIQHIIKHKNDIWLNNIAVPVRSFIEYAVANHTSLLDSIGNYLNLSN